MRQKPANGPIDDGGFIESVRFIDEESINWDTYPFTIPAVLALPKISLKNPINIFVGENGSGKSTIVEALAGMLGINAEGGSKNYNFSTTQTDSILKEHLGAKRSFKREGFAYFLRAETMYNVFTEMGFQNDAGANDLLLENEKLYKNGVYEGPNISNYRDMSKYGHGRMHSMSHGESFFEQLTQFRKNGLYILDEPEAALSPSRQLATVKLLHDLAYRQECQIFLATHSPILAAIPDAQILQLTSNGIEEIAYEDTELYRTYWAFMKNPGTFIDRLFRD